MINEHDEVTIEEAYTTVWNFEMGISAHDGTPAAVSQAQYDAAVQHLRTAPDALQHIQSDLYETYANNMDQIFGRGNWNDNVVPYVS